MATVKTRSELGRILRVPEHKIALWSRKYPDAPRGLCRKGFDVAAWRHFMRKHSLPYEPPQPSRLSMEEWINKFRSEEKDSGDSNLEKENRES
jgi:hypothetical protein